MTGISSDVYSSTAQPASTAAGTQRTQNAAGAAGTSGTAGTDSTASSKQVTKGLGKTVGNVSLSEEGAAYYKKLKEKFKGMNFVLVSEDMKDQVQANAGAYGSANGMTVLVDVDKIERMAKDEEYRAKYEGIISQASSNLQQLSAGLSQGGSSNGVVGYGATINDNGTASYFAVIDKSLAAQQERIAEKRAEKKAEAKEAEKKAEKQAEKERLEERRGGGKDGEYHTTIRAQRMNEGGWEKGNAYLVEQRGSIDGNMQPKTLDPKNQVTVQADSIEALLQKINDTVQNIRVDNVRTPAEQALGGSIDFRG